MFEMSAESLHSLAKEAAWGMRLVFIKCFIRTCRNVGPSRLISALTREEGDGMLGDQDAHLVKNTQYNKGAWKYAHMWR